MGFEYVIPCLQVSFLAAVVYKYLSIYHPKFYENIGYSVTYNCIYYFSKAQLFYMKWSPIIMKTINPTLTWVYETFNKENVELEDDVVEFIKKGDVILRTTQKEILSDERFRLLDSSFFQLLSNFDFILYSPAQTNDKVILYKIPNCIEDFNYEKTDYKLMLAEIKIENITLRIDFCNENYNYYIVNNIIDPKFLQYFLKKYHYYNVANLYSFDESTHYQLKVIDENIQVYELDNTLQTYRIKLKKNNIEIAHYTKIFESVDDYLFRPIQTLISENEQNNVSEYDDLPDLIPVDTNDDDVVDDDDDDLDSDLPELIDTNDDNLLDEEEIKKKRKR
jgi:hypothetical protein